MAFKKEENNIFFIALVITVIVFPFISTQNIDCKGKAFHCVNSTHFKICVDLGGGISTTVDDFVIPCPRNTVCKGSNYFECEYITTTTLKSTQKSEVPNDISVTPSLKNIDIATTFYNKTSENKLSEIVMSTISSSTLEFTDLTTESALQNITSDFSDSDKYRSPETTIGEPTTANEELAPITFAKVILDNIEYNISGTEIGNALSNSNLSKNFNEDYKISDIENSTSLFIDFSSDYNAKNKQDYENQNIQQLPVTVLKNTIFDGLTNSSPIDYTTEIDQGSYNTKYFVNGASTESDITSVSYNKTSNRSISSNNISNFTETESISLTSNKPHNLTNIATDKISVQNVNDTQLVEIGEIITDPTIELHVLDIWDNMPTSEVYKNKANNGSPKALSETSKAVKYTATDKNIFYNPVTDTEAENFVSEKIDNTTTESLNSNHSSRLNNKTEEIPNLNYANVDLLQNTKKSTINDVFKNIISPDEQPLTTEPSNFIPKTFLTPNLNSASQFEDEGITIDFNNTQSKNSFANVSLSTISSLKLEEKENTESVRDMSYATEPSPKLEEISSQSYLLKQTSSFSSSKHNNNSMVINTESTKMTDISMKDQNTYSTPTLYTDEHSIESTTVKDDLHSEVFTSVKGTTINHYNEKVTIVPNNTFINTEKVARTNGSNIHYNNVDEKIFEELSTTQAAFQSFSSNESVHKGTSTLDPIKFNDNIFVSLYQFGNTTVQDIELRDNITNDEIEVHTGNYNSISNTNYINDIINSDAIIVKRSNSRTNLPNENKNVFNTFENFNVTDVFNTSLIEPRVNFTGNTNVLILDTTTKMPIENVDEKRTDIVSAVGKTNITRDFGLELEHNENNKIKMSDGVLKDSNLKILREGTENIENRKQQIFSTTEMGVKNGNKVTEINIKIFGDINDTIENSVNNPTSSHINITKENNTQILTYFNNTDHMNVNSNDNNEKIQIFNNLKITAKKYTTLFTDTTFIDTTVPIFSVTSDTEITTQMYNSLEYNSSQQMTNDTMVNDNDIKEIITLKNSEIIDLNVAAKIILPIENISKNASENVETNKGTLINLIENSGLDQNNVTNKQNFNKTKLIENSTTHIKNTTGDTNILKETHATVIDIPSYYNSVSKEEIMNINMQNNINGEIKEMKLIEENNNTIQTNGYAKAKEIKLIDDRTVVNDRSGITNGVISKYNKTIINESKLTTNNTSLDNTDNIANLLANTTTNMPEQYGNNDSNKNGEKNVFSDTEIKNNATKSNKMFFYEFDNTNKVSLPQLNITDKSQDTRTEPINIENNKTNHMIPPNTVIQNMSVINTPKFDIYSFNDSNISLNTSKNGVREANKQTNFKNSSADQMLELVNEDVKADNISAVTKVFVATYTKNITTAVPLSSQATLKNSYQQNETNVNDSFNKSQDLHISSINKNLTGNLETSSNTLKLHIIVTNNSMNHKNDLDIVFNATQPSNIHFTTDYKDMGTSSFKYGLVNQQDLSSTGQSDDRRLFSAESKTFSTTSASIIRDDLSYTDVTSHLVKDNANIPQIPKTVGFDFTTLPYEGKHKVTHSMKDITNIEENKNVYGNLYTKEPQMKVATTVTSFLSVTTPNIRQIPATQPADILKPITCKIKSHGKYPDENDCNKFYICIGKQTPITGKCPIGTVFSDIKKQCTNNLSHCIRNNQFKCLIEGRFVDVMSNNYYYICAKNKRGFVRFKLKCQEGYYLNRNNIHCMLKDTFEEDSKNTSESRTKESVSRETFQFTKSFICVNEGKFEFPEDCRKYYMCTKKSSVFRRRLKQCESDEVFDTHRKKCVDNESYECRF